MNVRAYVCVCTIYVQMILNRSQERKFYICVVHACITAVKERSGSHLWKEGRKDVRF